MSGAGTMRASGSTALVVSAREVVETSGGRGTQAARQGQGISMAEMTALGKQAGFNVGKPLMGKHRSGGWHACTVVAKIDAETYQVRWTDGDTTDTTKKMRLLKEMSDKEFQEYSDALERVALIDERGLFTDIPQEGGKRKRIPIEKEKSRMGSNVEESESAPSKAQAEQECLPRLPKETKRETAQRVKEEREMNEYLQIKWPTQKVNCDLVEVRHIDSGPLAGQAGGFAVQDIPIGTVVGVYAGQLIFASELEKAREEMLARPNMLEWPPQLGHPLLEIVMQTNYEMVLVGDRSRETVVKRVLRSLHGPKEELIIIPYPNFGGQCMSVNAANEGEHQNCTYAAITYKGFPYIFLLAVEDIRKGDELLTSYGNDFFQSRDHCQYRIPGLDSLTAGMSPLSRPPLNWREQLCIKSQQIFFSSDPKISRLRHKVEKAWADENHFRSNQEISIQWDGEKPAGIHEKDVKAAVLAWLDPEGSQAGASRYAKCREEEEKAAQELDACYKTLEVSRDWSRREIETKIKRLLLKYHPDKNAEDVEHASQRFHEIREAECKLKTAWGLQFQKGTKKSRPLPKQRRAALLERGNDDEGG